MRRSSENPPDVRIRPPGDSPLVEAPSALSRETFVELARDYLGVLKKSLIDIRRPDTHGRSLVQAYSHSVDALVGLVFQRAVEENGAAKTSGELAIIGMGGYGRAELAPYSDVDILILCKRKTAAAKDTASAFVQLMWDVGFELGHAVESIIESESTLARHMDSRTALFESRWICGSRRIATEIAGQIRRLRKKDREAYVRRKIRDAVARHRKYDSHYQLIEPNVKSSPGGMRDYQTLVWLGMVSSARMGLSALTGSGLLLPGETRALERAYDFLLRVRVELHLATQSKQDQLTLAMQKSIAEHLGYRARGGHLAVELFMRDYYNETRTIFGITEDILEELDYGRNIGVLLGRRRIPKASGRLTVRINRRKLQTHPLYVFWRQKLEGRKLARSVKRRLSALLHEELTGRAVRNQMRREFPSLLRRDNVTLVLRSMHETGFLGVVIPEYDDLTSLKRYDLYHHYTVDEHSFQVLSNLEELAQGSPRNEPLSRLYSEVADKTVLHLAALLHDIGKIEGRGHAKKGAVLARKILTRMSLERDVIDQVSRLIEIHLLMSHFSQRRDTGDRGTLQSFCRQVGSRTTLKHLCLLTYADLKATSPAVWTEWKRNLLWDLYVNAYDFMARSEKEPDRVYKARKRTLLRAFKQKPERERALAHLDLLPGRYLLTMRASQVRRHLDMIDALGRHAFVVDHRRARRNDEITFCTWDKPFRLSQLCGVLTLNDLNILYAHAFTRRDGKVLDVFQVQDLSGTAKVDEARIDKIRSDLAAVLGGRIHLNHALERHLDKWKRRGRTVLPVQPRIDFDNDTSADVTIIDIHAMDRPGLLFKVTRVLSDEGLTIHRARISTEAHKAIDSFDVHGKGGGKVTDATVVRNIRRRLEEALA